jgi:pimeloyl-ACP methyl ester carboxylesterase
MSDTGVMAATDTRYVDVDGHPVRVRECGPEAGVPVVLIHGIGRSLEDWQPTQDLLATDHRVISLDLPGFGLTRRMKGHWGLEGFARAVVSLLATLEEHRPVHVMGNSLGGAVAMTLAANHPDRVASLLLVNSAGFGREANVSVLPMAYGALSSLPVVGRRFRKLARTTGIQSLRDVFFDPSHLTDDMIRHAGELNRQQDFRVTFVATAARLGLPVVGTYPWWRRTLLTRLDEADIPTMVVWGDADSVLPASHFHAAVAALPRASSHLFPDTGHMPQLERAEEFAELAAAFVAAQEGAAREDGAR